MSQLKDPRIVKIFFSSPFGGMEEEREELTRRYFPTIHHLCNSHGLQFAAVDMRWGITAESSDKAQVINICLREIDRSDLFVGFFGQRYGWHGADDAVLQKNFDNAVPNYPWLDKFRDKSVTELEFLHGFLNDPGRLPATVFFRDKAYDDKIRAEGVAKGDKKQVFKYSAESDLSVSLMDDLKQRCTDQKDKSLGVHIDYKTPAEAAKVMNETILSYLKTVLLVDLENRQKSPIDELRGQHDAFLASRTRIYVHEEEYFTMLNKQLLSETRQHVVVKGEAGSGKSALLCNWVKALKQMTDLKLAVVYHFIGFADNSTDVNSILQRVVNEFELIASHMVDGEGQTIHESLVNDDTDKMAVTRALVQKMEDTMTRLVAVGKLPVLVLDGLDKAVGVSQINKVLFWLPERFPASSMVVLSTLDTDTDRLQELTNRQFLSIHVQPLVSQAQHQLCLKLLEASGKELSPPQVDRIVDAEMTKNPLFLQITMTELIAFGYFRLLDKKIDSLVSADSIVSLFGEVIKRLEEDYNVEEYDGNLVEQVLCCIRLSNQGMFETEIIEIFSVPNHVWSPLFFAIENIVINQSGRLQFGFGELGMAVDKRYLQEKEKRDQYLKLMVEYFDKELEQLSKSSEVSGQNIAVFRAANELPDLYLQLGDKAALTDCLADFFVFSYLERANIYKLVALWHETELVGNDIADRLMQSFDKRLAELYVSLADRMVLDTSETPGMMLIAFPASVSNCMNVMGFKEPRKHIIRRAIKIIEDGKCHGVVKDMKNTECNLALLRYQLACVLCEDYHTADEGIALHMQIMENVNKTIKTDGESEKTLMELANCYHGIGVGYITLQRNEDAPKMLDYFKKSVEIIEKLPNPDKRSLGASWANIAYAYKQMDDFDSALVYMDKSIQAMEEHYFGETPPELGEMLHNKALVLKKQGRLDEAQEAYKRALEAKIKGVGRQHESVAMGYMNLGALEMTRDQYERAIEYLRPALDILEKIGLAWTQTYIMTIENLMGALDTLRRYPEIDEHFMDVLNWRVSDGSMDRCIASLYREMVKYYLREGQHKKAYTTCHALLSSAHHDGNFGSTYCWIDMAYQQLQTSDPDFVKDHPDTFLISNAVKHNPAAPSLVGHYCSSYLIPAGQADELVQVINRWHEADQSGMGSQVYVSASNSCIVEGAVVSVECLERVLQEGLKQYPKDLELNLAMAKMYSSQDKPEDAYPFMEKVATGQMDNPGLLMMAAFIAARSGHCDRCDEYCRHVINTCSEDNPNVQKAKDTMEWNAEVRAHFESSENETPEKEGTPCPSQDTEQQT